MLTNKKITLGVNNYSIEKMFFMSSLSLVEEATESKGATSLS